VIRMKHMSWCRNALFIFCLLLTHIGFASNDLWSTVWDSHEQAKQMSYSGMLTTRSGEYNQSSRLSHFSTADGEFELVEKLDGQPSQWIRQNDKIQCVFPDKKIILSERRQSSLSFPRVFSLVDGTVKLDSFYSIEELPHQRVAGRLVRVLKLSPKDSYRYFYRLYVDKEFDFLLRSELLNKEGTVLEQVGFSEIVFNPDPITKPHLLDVGPGWREFNTKSNIVSESNLPYILPKSLIGFTKTETFCRTKDNDVKVNQTVFSDGLSTLSVFVQKAKTSQTMPSMPIGHGAVMSKSEIQGNYMVTVLGEVPTATLDYFLKTIQWKSQ
jgi:sigma-E factor negative regulatory protein RseB